MDRAASLARIDDRLCARGLRLPGQDARRARKERLLARIDKLMSMSLAETGGRS